MIVVVDIGNSNIVIGLWRQDNWCAVWRLDTKGADDLNAYKLDVVQRWIEGGFEGRAADQVILSSVVPDLTRPFAAFCHDVFACDPLVISGEVIRRLDLGVSRPDEVGSDLVANAYAAVATYDADCLVVDFGTALSFTTVTQDRDLLGVTIAPGIKTAMRSLHTLTAQLPEVPLEMPDAVIGTHTVHAIQSGVMYGYEGLISHLIHKHKQAVGKELVVVAAGGLISVLPSLHKLFDHVCPDLTLDGLRLIGLHLQSH